MTLTLESLLLERISDGFLALDADWCCTFVNRQACEILGVRPEDVIGRDIRTMLPDLVDRPLHQACERAFRTQRQVTLEERFTQRDRWYECRIHPSQEGLSIFFTRSSEQSSADREDEARYYRLLFEANPRPMWVFDQQTLRFLAVNDAALAQYGYTRDEMLGMTIRDIRPLEDVSRLEAKVEQPLQGFEGAELWRHRRRDGSLLWVEISAHTLTFAGRAAELILAYDVTATVEAQQERERLLAAEQEAREQLQEQAVELETTLAALHEANNALQESEQRYRRFFEDDLTANYIARADGTITMCNQAFARVFGFASVEEASRINVTTLFPDPSVYDALLARVQLAGRLEALEFTLRRLDGRPVDVVANMIATRAVDDELTEIRGYLFDVTERNALSAQLAQAQKMEVVGRLAGGVAHDFNNLLTGIIGHAHILLDGLPASHPHRSSLEEIARAGERSAQLTRQLLAFSRKQVLQARDVDLNETVSGMSSFIRRLIGEHIMVTTRLDPALRPIRIDPGQMEQVIMNLVVNARDAMSDGGQLAIQTARVRLDDAVAATLGDDLTPGDYAVLSVRDTGCGMDADTMGHIFEPFFTTKEVGKGTGLGLASVFGIVKQSGGSIMVQSRPGAGSTFLVYLPVAPEAAEPASGSSSRQAATTRTVGSILLVEDDSAVRALTRMVLTKRGYTVIAAETGQEALRLVASHVGLIELLLTDVVMPGMTGKALAGELRQRLPGLRVLYMSGYTDDVINQHGVLEEGVAFLEKPFTPDVLVQRVAEILAPHGA